MANPERRLLFTGARARILAKGIRIGWARGVSGSRIYQREAVNVVDNLEVEEFALLGYQVSLRMQIVGLVGKSLVQAGLMPELGQSNEDHLRNALLLEPFTVQIEDNITRKVQREFQEAEIEEESFSLDARSLMMLDVSLVGKRMPDAAEL